MSIPTRPAVLALLFVVGGGCGPSWREQLLRTGVAARAVVASISETGWYINRQPECEIRLRVEPKEGAPFPAVMRQVVPMTQLAQLQPGRVVTVRYDQADPTRVVLEALGHVAVGEADAQRLIDGAAALAEELHRPGAATAADAIVITFEPTGVTVNGDNPLATLRIKVLPSGGKPFDATLTGVFGRAGLHKYQPGAEIHVVFDPANPARVAFDRSRTTTITSPPTEAR